jgi:SET domain-containing protein
MMRVACEVKPSAVHGRGLFTREAARGGTLLWSYQPGLDRRMPLAEADLATLHHGYINPRRPGMVTICGDEARWWNFPPEGAAANAVEGLVDATGEARIVAARDIAAGEELWIETASDADAARKLGQTTTETGGS